MYYRTFEELNLKAGDIIGIIKEGGESIRCYYYGGYNRVRGSFDCYNFKTGKVESVALSSLQTLKRA